MHKLHKLYEWWLELVPITEAKSTNHKGVPRGKVIEVHNLGTRKL